VIIPVASFTNDRATDLSYRLDDVNIVYVGIQNLGKMGRHDYAIAKIGLAILNAF